MNTEEYFNRLQKLAERYRDGPPKPQRDSENLKFRRRRRAK